MENYIIPALIGIGIFLWAASKLATKNRSFRWLWFALLTPWIPFVISICLHPRVEEVNK